MPKKEQMLQDKLQRFNEKYNIDIKKMIDDFAALNLPQDKKQERYTEIMSDALALHVKNEFIMKDGGKYDFSNFSIAEFAEDFEDIVQAKNETNLGASRPAYEGIKLDELFDLLADATRPYSYPLAELWASDFHRGTITVKSMKKITNNALNVLTDPFTLAKDFTDEQKHMLINIVAAKKTMEAIRENRSNLWRFFHPIQNYREKNYLKLLEKNAKDLEAVGYNVNGVEKTLEDETLSGAYEKLLDHEAYEERFEKEREKGREVVEAAAAKGIIYSIVSKVEKKLEDKQFETNLTNALMDALPGEGDVKENAKDVLKGKIKYIIDKAQQANAKYHSAVITHSTAKIEMSSYAVDMFRDMLSVTKDFNYDLSGRIAAAQKLTDVIMEQLSPVAFAKNVLGEYSQGYVLNGAGTITTLHLTLDKSEEEVKVALEIAKNIYNGVENVRENVVFPPDEFEEPKDYYTLNDGGPIDFEELWSKDPFADPSAGDNKNMKI